MVDFYSPVSLYVVYIAGGLILAAIIWSLVNDAAKAKPQDRKKYLVLIACLVIGSVAVFGAARYFCLSEKLFPSFYANEEMRQQNPWQSDFDLKDWEQPF